MKQLPLKSVMMVLMALCSLHIWAQTSSSMRYFGTNAVWAFDETSKTLTIRPSEGDEGADQSWDLINVMASYNTINRMSDNTGKPMYTKSVVESFNTHSGTYIQDTPSNTYIQDYRYVDFVPTTKSVNIYVGLDIPNNASPDLVYDIYLVTCPIWLKDDYKNLDVTEWNTRSYRFRADVFERETEGENAGQFPRSGVRLENPNPIEGNANTIFQAGGLVYDDDGQIIVNDTTYLGQYQFKNAHTGPETGILVQISSYVTSKQTDSFSREMLISGIILKPHGKETLYDIQDDVENLVVEDGIPAVYYSFSGCQNLKSVTIPESVNDMSYSAFQNCNALTSVTLHSNSVASQFTFGSLFGSQVKEYRIGKEVTDISYNTFWRSSDLASIVVEEGNPKYDSRNDCNAIIETSSNTLVVGSATTTIPNDVTSIGRRAFRERSGLTSVNIPSNVTFIDEEAFYDCNGLSSITIANSSTKLGSNVFDGTLWYDNQADGVVYVGHILYKYKGTMPENTEIEIKEGTTIIGEEAFQGCRNLISVVIPEGVTSIGREAFYDCSSLTSVIVPSSVNEIGNAAFLYTPWIENQDDGLVYIGSVLYGYQGEMPENTAVEIREGTTSIYQFALSDREALTSVTIPNSVTSIGHHAFSGCIGLTSVTIPNSVTTIDNGAFGYTGLTSVVIPSSVTSIGEEILYSCHNLTSIEVEEGNTRYDSRNNSNAIIETASNTLVQGCVNTVIPNTVTAIDNRAFRGIFYESGKASVSIPNSVTTIGDHAFAYNSFESVVVPNSVTSIGYGAFAGCASIEVEEGNTRYDSRNNCNAIIETRSNTLIQGCVNTIIPDNVTGIGDYAFHGCSGLTSLASLNIPESVTTIGYEAFSACDDLTSVTIPKHISSLGYGVFYGCKNLTFAVIECEYEWGMSTIFGGCDNLTSLEFHCQKIGRYGGYQVKSVIIGEEVTSIDDMAFYDCYNLKDVYCYATNPPQINSYDAFYERHTRDYTLLHVPASVLETYQKNYSWRYFRDIVPIKAELAIKLDEGWNWVSHNLANNLSPTDIFGKNVVEVKSQTKGLVRDSQYGMVGNLTEMVATEAYKVKTTEADAVPYQLSSDLFDATTNAINLKQGWNWIGYPMANEKSLEGALRNFLPMKDDCIVSQESFTTYNGSEWVGTLDVFTPGKGYMYKSGEEKPLYFSKASSRVEPIEAKARTEAEESEWTCDIHKYPNRMPAIVCLYKGDMEANVSDYDVAAFCGDECRGVGKVVKGVVMMNVCGEGSETITFKAIDRKSDIVLDINESVSFSGDVLGAYTEPFKLTLNGESLTGIATIKSETAVDAIYNMAGQRVSSDKQTLPKGVYIYKGKKVMIK
ncbi:MAG: leucine-rich repeat domain-containing protein [Bacteroidaceae bacterium]|nr:leucine-rich repeat domain-containing protein [Bacteroidaceae bacterium]